MAFESVTEWQGGDYIVRLQAGLFRTAAEAEAFGQQPMRLVREDDRLVLYAKETGVELDEAYDENITVFKCNTGHGNKTVLSADDFDQVAIRIADFGQYPDLASFGSLSYGVNHATELRVASTDHWDSSRAVRIVHHQDVGDQAVFVMPAHDSAPDALRAALYCQFKCEKWHGDGAALTNLGVAALLVSFYGYRHCPRSSHARTIDLHSDREALALRFAGGDAWADLMNDGTLERDGLRMAMMPHVIGSAYSEHEHRPPPSERSLSLQRQEALSILETLLIAIREIASQASFDGPHFTMGRHERTDWEAACKAIWRLSDASHKLPEAIAGSCGPYPKLLSYLRETCETVYGPRTPPNWHGVF